MARSTGERRVTIGMVQFPIQLLDRIEAYAAKKGLSRVAAIRQLVTLGLQQENM